MGNVKISHIIIGLFVGLLALSTKASIASETNRPEFDRLLDPIRERSILDASKLPPGEVFERLKNVEYLADEFYMEKTIFKAFHHRLNEGIELSMKKLSLPEKEFAEGKVTHRSRDLYVAKRIFEVFPEVSIPKLVKLFESGDAVTKGNVIRVSGKLAATAIDRLLANALNDKTFCDQEDPEADGPPMRVCDLAYNHFVLRFQVKDVLRTLGPIHRMENRDYHIAILKGKM